MVAENLTRQTQTGEAARGEPFLFRRRHVRRLSLDELDAARRAPGKSAAGVENVDVRILLDGEDHPLLSWNIECSVPFNRQF